MKKYTLPFLIICISILGVGCKKEKSPELEITVLDSNSNALRGALVTTSVPGSDQGIVKEGIIDSVRTDGFGKAFFKYDNTILLRVDALYQGARDSLDILLETKRLSRGDENNYERTMRIDI